MGILVNLPCTWGCAERYQIVGPGACEGTGLVIVSVAVGAWTCSLEHLRVRRWFAAVGCTIRAAATELLFAESLARALASHPFSTYACHAEFGRARTVHVDHASRGCTVIAGSTLGDYKHWEVVPIYKANVVEVLATISVDFELRQGGGRRSSTARAFQLPGATIASNTREFAC